MVVVVSGGGRNKILHSMRVQRLINVTHIGLRGNRSPSIQEQFDDGILSIPRSQMKSGPPGLITIMP
jgi:hypothetical protein